MIYLVKYAGSLIQQAFDVHTETGDLAYKIRGNSLMFGAKTQLLDANDQELALVKQKVSLTHYSYNVFQGDQKIANITKAMLSFSPKFKITGLDWSVQGKILSREYKLLDKSGQTIATIDRQGLLDDSAYRLELLDSSLDPVMVLAVVTGLDAARSQS